MDKRDRGEGRKLWGRGSFRGRRWRRNDGRVENIERWYGSCKEPGLSQNAVGVIIWFVGSWLHGKNKPSRGRARTLALVVGSSPENLPASH